MLAQATQKLIEAVKPLLGSPAHEFGHLLADRVKFWRFKQAVQIVTRANEIREAKGVKHEVDLKFFLPFLEECSKENDENISEMWSQLLASSSGQDTGFDLICVEYLSKLGKKEADLLKRIDNRKLNQFLQESYLAGDPSECILHHLTHHFAGLSKCTIDIAESKLEAFANCPTQIHFDDEKNGHSIEGYTRWYRENTRPMMALLRYGLIEENKLNLTDQEERQSLTFLYVDRTAIGSEFLSRCEGR